MKRINLTQQICDLYGSPIVFGEQEVLQEDGRKVMRSFGKTYAQLAYERIASLQVESEEDNRFAFELLKKLYSASVDTDYLDEELIFIQQAVFAYQPVIVRGQYHQLINGVYDGNCDEVVK